MVDFQSRDTRRADDEEAEAGDDGEEEPAGAGADGTDAAATEGGETAERTAEPPGEMTYALLTVGPETGGVDPADVVVSALDGTDARVVARRTVDPSFDAVQGAVDDLVDRRDVAAVVTLGGVGVGPDDVTTGAVEPLFDKRLDGFGELYRVLSHEREGTSVVRSRVTAGLVGSVPVFCLPADPEAARHGVERLVLAEAEPIAEAAAGSDAGGSE